MLLLKGFPNNVIDSFADVLKGTYKYETETLPCNTRDNDPMARTVEIKQLKLRKLRVEKLFFSAWHGLQWMK